MRYLAAIESRIGINDAISISFSLFYLFDHRRNNGSGNWEVDFIIAGRVASGYSLFRIDAEISKDLITRHWSL